MPQRIICLHPTLSSASSPLTQTKFMSSFTASINLMLDFSQGQSYLAAPISSSSNWNIHYTSIQNSFITHFTCGRAWLAQLVRSTSSVHKVPSSIPGSAEIWTFVQLYFPPKLIQRSILPGKVNKYHRLLGAKLQWISVSSV